MEDNNQELKNRNRALIISLGSHCILLVLFFMIAAWTEPDPPIPEYGIELSFFGETASTKVVESTRQSTSTEKQPSEQANVETLNEVEEQGTNSQTEKASDESVEEPITEDIKSPDINENLTEETSNLTPETEEEKQESLDENDVAEVVDTNSADSSQATSPEPPIPTLDDRAIFESSDSSENESGENSSAGSSLNMSGWIWDFQPEPDDSSTENGKIVFKITVDDQGEIIGIQTVEATVSPDVKKNYENAVMELTFSKTSDNKSTAPTSSGTITFIIRSK